MLACHDPNDNLSISDANSILRTLTVIRASDQLDHILFLHITLIY